jgi:mycothiol synthase
MQFPAFERAVLDATIAATPTAYPISVWSQRVSLDRALEDAGFAATRSLAFMAVDLPLPNPGVEHRSLIDGEWPAIVSINNDAFAAHREAASLTVDDARRIMGEPGFSEEGVRVVEIDEVPVAFCWTKVHPNGDGEVYRIATSPAHQGRGLGRQAVLAGFEWLARQPSVERGTLWVDEANDAALSLYRDLGMEILRRNREFTRS